MGSVPGRHMAEKKHWFGHMKLRKLLNENGPAKEQASKWPVVGQFSSIGSLGASKENWLSVEFLQSLATVKGTSSVPLAPVEFKLVCLFIKKSILLLSNMLHSNNYSLINLLKYYRVYKYLDFKL